MAVYAIGDVQGCLVPLRALLRKLRFDPAEDRLWFTGDLVNRGPQSAEVLRFIKELGPRAVSVLGNHDLHLLAIAAHQAPLKKRDVLDGVLKAPDREALLGWLRQRPLLHHDAALGYTLVHAGLLPQWGLPEARRAAAEVESLLHSNEYTNLFAHMYGDLPDQWDSALSSWPRLRATINALTRLRYCDAGGRMALSEKGAPGTQPPHLMPWFAVPGRRSRTLKVVFGHWSALGLWRADGVICLDSGCLWGRVLTAVRLDLTPPKFFSVPCPQAQPPH